MACNSCTSKIPCKRHRKKSKASNWFVPNVALPPPYGVTFETDRPDEVDICKQKTVSFAESNLGGGVNIGANAGVRHRIIVSDNNNSVKLDATFTVGVPFSISNIVIGNANMIIKWFENDAILTIEPDKILLQSSGFMQHFVEYNGNWSVNFDNTELKRWQVDFIYDNPIVIVGQPNSLWVDDGCAIDFSAQNNTNERPIEIVNQINGISGSLGIGTPPFTIALAATSGIPLNQNYTSNPILSTTNIVIQIGEFAKRYTLKNQGSDGGYVKVEWNGGIEIDYIPANTSRSYIIAEDQIVKTTWYNIEPITLLPEASKININEGAYKFAFARFVSATFIDEDNFSLGSFLLNGGDMVAGIDDENGIAKARSFTFTMPDKNVDGVITFRNLSLLCDYDFANPYCVDNATTTVAKIKDRTQNTSDFVQTTPSQRPAYVAGGVRVNHLTKIGGNFATTYNTKMTYVVGNINKDDNINTRSIIGAFFNDSTLSSLFGYETSVLILVEPSGFNSSQSLVTWWNGLGNSSPNPKFALRSSSKKNNNWCIFDAPSTKIIHDNTGTIYSADVGSNGVNINGGFMLGSTESTTIEATYLRILSINENITADENTVFLSKIRTKYNIT